MSSTLHAETQAVLRQLSALGARIECGDDKVVLRAGAQPVPGELIAAARACKAELAAALPPAPVPAVERIDWFAEEAEGAPVQNVQNQPAIDPDDLKERAAIIEYGAGVPREWANGYAVLSTMAVPIGFTPERWQAIVDEAGHFIDHWAVRAATSGWSALDVFGAHETVPDVRFDCMGLLVALERNRVVSIDANGADLMTPNGTHLRFYRRAFPAEIVALWDLVTRRDV